MADRFNVAQMKDRIRKDAMALPRGTEGYPGRNTRQKAGLTGAVLDSGCLGLEQYHLGFNCLMLLMIFNTSACLSWTGLQE